jgi:hypothetical protein
MSWWKTDQWRAYEAACGVEKPRHVELAEATFQTRVVDLRPTELELWQGLRKSYRQTVRDAAAIYSAFTEGYTVEQFRELHFEQAKRETRHRTSWDLMSKWHADGQLLLVTGARGLCGKPLAFAAFEVWDGWAYYGHAASTVPDLAHALIWKAIKALKECGVTRLEMGWQNQDTTDKGKRIEFFRRGFGGIDVPAREGEAKWD